MEMECSLCGGPVGLIGVLGDLAHLACRNCGMQFSVPAADWQEEEDDE